MNEQLENLKWLVENLPDINESMSFLITELEETNRAFDELDSDYINLIKENKRYREFIKLVSDPWEVARKIVKGTDKKGASAEEIVAWIEIESEKLLGESE